MDASAVPAGRGTCVGVPAPRRPVPVAGPRCEDVYGPAAVTAIGVSATLQIIGRRHPRVRFGFPARVMLASCTSDRTTRRTPVSAGC
jgi:hypothetical protein